MIEGSFEAYPLPEWLGRLMVTENYLALDQRMKSIISQSLEERYKIQQRNEPIAVQKIPPNDITRYLNVTQKTLNRISKDTFNECRYLFLLM